MNGTMPRSSALVVIVHGLVVLAIILASLPRAGAAGPTPPPRPRSPVRVNLSGVPEGLAASEWDTIQRLIRQAEYQLTWHEPSSVYIALNRANGLRLAFDAGGVQARADDPAENWTWGLVLTGYGTAGAVRPVTSAPELAVDGNHITYRWDRILTGWYVNDERGLGQGFAVAAPPAETRQAGLFAESAGSQIVLEMALRTDLIPHLAADAQSVSFGGPTQGGWQPDTEVLLYDSLRVSDAAGRQLPAHLNLSRCAQSATCQLQLLIDTTSASYPLTVAPLLYSQVSKLVASDAAAQAFFGNSVAISGDTIVVGAWFEDGEGSSRGAVYIYTRNGGGADNWGQVKKLIASDAADDDYFGFSVAISGDTVVIGALGEDGAGSDRGAAYIYARNNGGADNWGQVTKLTASDAADDDHFGSSVAISGDTAVVGALYEDGAGRFRGAAYVYARNSGGADNWGEVKKLVASDAADDDYFGYPVAISGDTVVVGAWGEDGAGSDRGAAYIYARNSGGADNWGQVKKLTASDAADDDCFGQSVAISGDTVVVGAPGVDGAGRDRGTAYIYARNSGGADNWGQVKKLIASDTADDDLFGFSVAISGDTVVVGAPGEDGAGSDRGAAYIYARNNGGADNWDQVTTLTASDAADGDYFGEAVTISGDTAVVGAPCEDGAGNDSGAAYTFVRLDGTWWQAGKPIASDAADYDYFGYSVATSGGTVVVGASFEDGAGTDRGAAYVYARNSGGADNWGEVNKLTASDAADGDYFGYSVAISGDTVVVGAHGEDGAGNLRGAAYVYARNSGGADNWGQVAKLTASDAADGDWFGDTVAISGDTVVVGAPGEDGAGSDRGAAYVFVRNSGGADNWGQVAKLTASDAADDDYFGYSVAISGDAAVIGAHNLFGAGCFRSAAYIYKRNSGGADNWGQATKLTASDAADGDWFGCSVAISGDTVLVGAYGAGSGRGAAYLYARNGGGADNWGEVKRLTASDAANDEYFGWSVAISGDTVAVGARCDNGVGCGRGAAYIYARNSGGADNWGEVKKLTAYDAADGDWFGWSVAISGDAVVVGALYEDGAGTDRGAAYVFNVGPSYSVYLPLMLRSYGAS